MQDGFDPDAFIAQMDAEEVQSLPESAPPNLSGFDPDAFINAMDRPEYANGFNPETPINQSPISIEDRAKLSVGNEAGKLKYLKERFGAVQKTKEGDLVVNDKGYWKRVDPEGLGDGDAWSMTKELLADAIDIAPEAVKIGAQIGASATAALASGGTSLLAQAPLAAGVGAALEAGETSLGRLVGTYEATPEEQMRDIAIESLMNLGGTAVAAGVKPTIGLIANGLKKSAEVIKSVAPVGSRDALKTFFGQMSGAGADNFDVLISKPAAVSNTMKIASEKYSNVEGMINGLRDENIGAFKRIVENVRPTLTKTYSSMADEGVDLIDDSFSVNLRDTTNSVFDFLEQNGLAQRLIDKNTGAIGYRQLTKKEIIKKFQQTGTQGDFALDDASLAFVDDITDLMRRLRGVTTLEGKVGAKAVLDIRRSLTNATLKLKEQADDAFLNNASRLVAGVKETFDNSLLSKFNLKTPAKVSFSDEPVDNVLVAMNKKYSDLMTELDPILKAAKQADKQGSNVPYENLYKSLRSRAGTNVTKKGSFDTALNFLSEKGGAAGKATRELFDEIQVKEAALAFTPFVKEGMVGSVGFTMIGSGILSANPAAVVGGATALASTSPRAQYNVIKSALAAKKLFSSLAPAQKGQLLSNPQALNAVFQTVVQTPQMQEQMKTDLLRQGTGGAF